MTNLETHKLKTIYESRDEHNHICEEQTFALEMCEKKKLSKKNIIIKK